MEIRVTFIALYTTILAIATKSCLHDSLLFNTIGPLYETQPSNTNVVLQAPDTELSAPGGVGGVGVGGGGSSCIPNNGVYSLH